jgi:hypothetical protein
MQSRQLIRAAFAVAALWLISSGIRAAEIEVVEELKPPVITILPADDPVISTAPPAAPTELPGTKKPAPEKIAPPAKSDSKSKSDPASPAAPTAPVVTPGYGFDGGCDSCCAPKCHWKLFGHLFCCKHRCHDHCCKFHLFGHLFHHCKSTCGSCDTCGGYPMASAWAAPNVYASSSYASSSWAGQIGQQYAWVNPGYPQVYQPAVPYQMVYTPAPRVSPTLSLVSRRTERATESEVLRLSDTATPELLVGNGISDYFDGKHGTALAYFDASLAKDAKNSLAWYGKALTERALGDDNAAVAALRQAEKLDGQQARVKALIERLPTADRQWLRDGGKP